MVHLWNSWNIISNIISVKEIIIWLYSSDYRNKEYSYMSYSTTTCCQGFFLAKSVVLSAVEREVSKDESSNIIFITKGAPYLIVIE